MERYWSGSINWKLGITSVEASTSSLYHFLLVLPALSSFHPDKKLEKFKLQSRGFKSLETRGQLHVNVPKTFTQFIGE